VLPAVLVCGIARTACRLPRLYAAPPPHCYATAAYRTHCCGSAHHCCTDTPLPHRAAVLKFLLYWFAVRRHMLVWFCATVCGSCTSGSYTPYCCARIRLPGFSHRLPVTAACRGSAAWFAVAPPARFWFAILPLHTTLYLAVQFTPHSRLPACLPWHTFAVRSYTRFTVPPGYLWLSAASRTLAHRACCRAHCRAARHIRRHLIAPLLPRITALTDSAAYCCTFTASAMVCRYLVLACAALRLLVRTAL